MKKLFALIVIALICGCLGQETYVEPGTTTSTMPQELRITVSSDKEVYYSNEYMNITCVIESEKSIENATVRFYGIYAGYYRIDEQEEMNIAEGYSVKKYTYQAPRCYGCAGILPKRYNVSFDVMMEGAVLASGSLEFEMQK